MVVGVLTEIREPRSLPLRQPARSAQRLSQNNTRATHVTRVNGPLPHRSDTQGRAR
jgi:hypothetical protein